MIIVQCELCSILAPMLYFVITSTEAKQEAKSMYGTFLAAFWQQIIVFFCPNKCPTPQLLLPWEVPQLMGSDEEACLLGGVLITVLEFV